MSIKTNTTSLQDLLERVNNLPNAGGNDPFANLPPFTYTVDQISGASYGFAKNSNGYYESQNKGQDNSYAICRVNLTVTSTCDITFDVINYADGNYDYAIFGNLDSALELSKKADSSAKKNFKGQQSASVVNVTYSGVTAGNHYIDVKFIKDYFYSENNDSVQFKLQEQGEPLSQEIINKILAADTDLVADNIKSGVNIFGITGTYVGDTSVEDGFITRTLSTYTNSRVSSIGQGAFAHALSLKSVDFPNVKTISNRAFYSCYYLITASFSECITIGDCAFDGCFNLLNISFPKCTTIGSSAFGGCSKLSNISFPACTTIYNYAFYDCSNLKTVSFPVCTTVSNYAFCYCSGLKDISLPVCTIISNAAFKDCHRLLKITLPVCTTIGSNAFCSCYSLTTASFPKYTTIGDWAFYDCYNLKSLYLTNSVVCTLSHSNAFISTPIGGYSTSAGTYGSIYVPASLLTSYKNATNWTYFSSRFVGI